MSDSEESAHSEKDKTKSIDANRTCVSNVVRRTPELVRQNVKQTHMKRNSSLQNISKHVTIDERTNSRGSKYVSNYHLHFQNIDRRSQVFTPELDDRRICNLKVQINPVKGVGIFQSRNTSICKQGRKGATHQHKTSDSAECYSRLYIV